MISEHLPSSNDNIQHKNRLTIKMENFPSFRKMFKFSTFLPQQINHTQIPSTYTSPPPLIKNESLCNKLLGSILYIK